MQRLILPALLLSLPLPGTALLSRPHPVSPGGGLQLLQAGSESGAGKDCAPLRNVLGAYYSIPVLVGTPPQAFSLIPDTGSPWVIVADTKCLQCNCRRRGDRCFEESRSTSLAVPGGNASGEGPERHRLMFGSGPVDVAVATDVVQIAGTPYQTRMESGVLLMMGQGFSFSGPFEGLLGLALPERMLAPEVLAEDTSPHSYTDDFLERSGVTSFQICLSDKGWTGSGGVIRFNAPGGEEKLGIAAKTLHWQVDFHGASVGGGPAPLGFCQETFAGQKSPCAAIVDSGTTYMVGPKEHVLSLFDALCDQWERCRARFQELTAQAAAVRRLLRALAHGGGGGGGNGSNSTVPAAPAGQEPYPWTRSNTFQLLLSDCNDWMGHKNGLQEMPPINFTVRGRSGNEQQLVLDPWDYIVAERARKVGVVFSHLHGHAYATGLKRHNVKSWTCVPAFGSMTVDTHENGPGWLFGLPMFYSYVVSYEPGTTPPSISFTRGTCGSCGKRPRSFTRSTDLQTPRRLYGPPRLPQHASVLQL